MNWNAKWIWNNFFNGVDNVYMEFRKTFYLKQVGEQAVIKVSANQEYIVWVNGQKLGRGPSPSDNEWQYYDEYDVREYLLPNKENVITALVYNFGSEDIVTQQFQGPGGFILQLNTEDMELVTDQSWKCRQSKRWEQDVSRQHKWNGFTEVYLAENEDNWHALEYNDADWNQADVVADSDSKSSPWKNLIKRDIPFLHEEKKTPEAIIDVAENNGLIKKENEFLENYLFDATLPGAMPSITYDFAREMVGYVNLKIDAPLGGVVQLFYGESLDVRLYDTIILKKGTNHIQPFGRRAFRYMKMRIHATQEPVVVKEVSVNLVHYPFEKEGKFHSNDPLLNNIWDVSAYTTKINSQDHLEDTPLRERALWVVDAVIMGRVIYQVFGDDVLLKKCLRQIAYIQNEDGSIPGTGPERNDMLLPDFCAHWIYGVWDYYQYSGDSLFLEELWPTLTKLMQWFEKHESDKGLFTINKGKGFWCFIDWADYIDRRDQVSALSMFYYKALHTAAEIANITGNRDYSQTWREKAKQLKENIQTYLWDQEKNVYADCLVDDELSESITYQTNFAAIWTGIMNQTEANAFINDYFKKKALKGLKGPFFYHIVLESLFSRGFHSVAMEEIRSYWGSMLERGATTWWEAFDPNTPANTIPHEFQGHTPTYLKDYIPVSQCHGWGASPGYLLNRHILGVDIAQLGSKKVYLQPYIDHLNKVEGTIPTKYGEIKVHWFKTEDETYEYHYSIPEELEWEGVFEKNMTVFINGELQKTSKEVVKK